MTERTVSFSQDLDTCNKTQFFLYFHGSPLQLGITFLTDNFFKFLDSHSIIYDVNFCYEYKLDNFISFYLSLTTKCPVRTLSKYLLYLYFFIHKIFEFNLISV